MMSTIFFVLVVLTLLLLVQARHSRANIKENLKLTQEIHTEIVIKRQTSGELVEKHVARNKAESEQLREAVKQNDRD